MTRLKMLLLLLASSLVLSGCGGFDVYKLPLPGRPDAGDNPMTIEVKFADVLDLVPRSTVKVNDVSVGQVSDVALEGTHARVTLELRNDVKLPDDAVAEIRQTSLLGEKFVSLSAPEGEQSTGLLRSGDVIPLSRAGRNPEVEEVLGALSLLLNGGGIAQLKTITQELNKALDGRESSARSVLHEVRTLVTQLDDNKADIVNAIDSLNTLALSVRKQQGSIDAALEELPSALRSIDTQRDDLVRMLKALDRLSGVGVRVIKASKDSTIATFRELQPVLKGFSDSGDNFAKAFSVFLTYPFVDEVVGRDPQVARNLHMGDYTNLSITLDVSIDGPSLPRAARRVRHHRPAAGPAHPAAPGRLPEEALRRRRGAAAGLPGEPVAAEVRGDPGPDQGPGLRRRPDADDLRPAATHDADALRRRQVPEVAGPHEQGVPEPEPEAAQAPRQEVQDGTEQPGLRGVGQAAHRRREHRPDHAARRARAATARLR